MNALSDALFGTFVPRLFAFVVAFGLFACGGDQKSPPAAPALSSQTDVIPPDLDWVVRIDIGRVRSALGPSMLAMLRDKALRKDDDGAALFLTDALERTNVLVVATRFDGTTLADAVLSLSGDFKGMDPRAYRAVPPWGPPIDLGGDVRRYDRKKPKARSDVMRLYLGSTDVIVAATEAELDSLEAVLENGAPSNRLKPRERGFLSAAFRLRLARRNERFPELSQAFASVRSFEGFADTAGEGFRVEVTAELESDAAASHAKSLLEAARAAFDDQGGRMSSLAHHTTVEAQGPFVVVRAELVREVLGDLVGEALR
ncbi:MAG TPA: hypothetical protein VF103_00515 [Polyangiaceae bacterium]